MTRSTEKQSAAISRRGRDCSTRRSAARRQSGHYHSWLHRVIVSRIFQVPEDDVFPTLYRANTMTALRQAMNDAGLTEREMDTNNHYPAYLRFSPVLFRRVGVS